MKSLLLLSLLALAATARAEPFPFPLIIAPRPTVPSFPAVALPAPSLTPVLTVQLAPVPVVRPVVVVGHR
jgi:hypothetical protein